MRHLPMVLTGAGAGISGLYIFANASDPIAQGYGLMMLGLGALMSLIALHRAQWGD